jgi:hypothetical protein
VLKDRGKEQESDQLLEGMADTAERLAKEHPQQAVLIWSYASVTYNRRLAKQLKQNPNDTSATRAAYDEFHRRFPAAEVSIMAPMP